MNVRGNWLLDRWDFRIVCFTGDLLVGARDYCGPHRPLVGVCVPEKGTVDVLRPEVRATNGTQISKPLTLH